MHFRNISTKITKNSQLPLMIWKRSHSKSNCWMLTISKLSARGILFPVFFLSFLLYRFNKSLTLIHAQECQLNGGKPVCLHIAMEWWLWIAFAYLHLLFEEWIGNASGKQINFLRWFTTKHHRSYDKSVEFESQNRAQNRFIA